MHYDQSMVSCQLDPLECFCLLLSQKWHVLLLLLQYLIIFHIQKIHVFSDYCFLKCLTGFLAITVVHVQQSSY